MIAAIITSLRAMERQMQGNEEAALAREAKFGETVLKLREADARIAQLEAALIHEYNEEWDVGDGITDAAKVQFLIDRTPK